MMGKTQLGFNANILCRNEGNALIYGAVLREGDPPKLNIFSWLSVCPSPIHSCFSDEIADYPLTVVFRSIKKMTLVKKPKRKEM